MPDKILAQLTACLWDLRSQHESQVRTLSAVQRLLDKYRGAGDARGRDAARRHLREYVNGLIAASATIQEVMAEVSRQIDVLASVERRHTSVRRPRQVKSRPSARG